MPCSVSGRATGGGRKPVVRVRLGLSALDGRDLPSTYIPSLPAVDPAQVGDPATATRVMVAELFNSDGTSADAFLLFEKSAAGYRLQFYDASINTVYSGTATPGVPVAVDGSPDLDAAFAAASAVGSFASLSYVAADDTPAPPPTQAGYVSDTGGFAVLIAAGTGQPNTANPPLPIPGSSGSGSPMPSTTPTPPVFKVIEPKSNPRTGDTTFGASVTVLEAAVARRRLTVTTGVQGTVPYDIFGKPVTAVGTATIQLDF